MITIKNNENPTGWMAYVRAYKAAHPNEPIDYQLLMKAYMKGEPV